MRCPILSGENCDLLLAYCDRKLEPELAATLDRHIESCADCRGVLAGQRLLWKALDTWEAAEIAPDFNRRLYQRIAVQDDPSWTRYFRPPVGSWRAAVAVASAAVVLLAAVLFRTSAPAPQVNAADEDIEQVERTLEDIEMLRELNAPPVDPTRTL